MKKFLGRYLIVIGALFMVMPDFSYGQVFKMYYRNHQTSNPLFFSVRDIDFQDSKKRVVLGGEFRESISSTEAYGYTLEIDMSGQEQLNTAIEVTTSSTNDGFRMGGLTTDRNGQTYVAGSFAGDFSQPSTLNEKTLSGIDIDGKLQWSQMEGSRHFADVAIDDFEDALVAVGAPDGVWTGNLPLAIVKTKIDGTLARYQTIYTPVINEAVKILDLPANQGFIVVAEYDTLGLKAPFVLHLDQDLNIQWSHVYTDFLTEFTVEDASYHPEGIIGLTGTSYDPVLEENHLFLLGIDVNGDFTYLNKFQVENEGPIEGYGISYYQHSADSALSGFLLCGGYHPIRGTVDRHALVIQTNIDGKQLWAYDYSNFSPQDYIEDEVARKIVFLSDRNMYAMAGEYHQLLQNSQRRRYIWMSKARLDKGKLNDNDVCSKSVRLSASSDSLGIYKTGQDTTGGGLQNFGYFFTDMYYTHQSCSYSHEVDDNRVSTDITPQEHILIDEYQIFDLSGRMVLKTSEKKESWKDRLSPGVYVIQSIKRGRLLGSEKLVLP